MSYKERLTPWAIVRLLPNREQTIINRFRSRSDADGHMQFLRRQMPHDSFEVIFDYQPKIDSEQLTSPS